MIVSVYGASGRTGHAFIAAADAAELTLRLHYRAKPSETVPTSATVVVGSLADPTAVREVLRGSDAAVVLFGARENSRIPYCGNATKLIMASMRTAQQTRLLVQTCATFGEMPGNVSLALKAKRLLDRRMGYEPMFQDRDEQERMVRASRLPGWTVIKPPTLTDMPGVAAVAADPALSIGLRSQLSRASLAQFLVQELITPRFAQQAVYVANQG